MPSQTTITLPAGVWTQLTSADVTAIRVQNLSGDYMSIMGTAGAVAPSSRLGEIVLFPGSGIDASTTLAQLFPGVAATRVYALSVGGGSASVSHA